MVRVINTKLGTHILCSSRSACTDPEVKGHGHMAQKPSRRTVVSDYSRHPVTLRCATYSRCRRGSACRYDCLCFLVLNMLRITFITVQSQRGLKVSHQFYKLNFHHPTLFLTPRNATLAHSHEADQHGGWQIWCPCWGWPHSNFTKIFRTIKLYTLLPFYISGMCFYLISLYILYCLLYCLVLSCTACVANKLCLCHPTLRTPMVAT